MALTIQAQAAVIEAHGTSGGGPRYFEIGNVAGDVETPLLIKVPGSSVTGKQSLFAVRRRGNPAAMPFLLQTELMTLGTDTALVATNPSAYSGVGSNAAQTTFATVTTSAVRYSTATFPTTPSVDVRGLYRVFLRCAGSTTSSSFGVILRHGVRAVNNTEQVVTQLTGGTYQTMADLGLVQLPEGYDPGTDGPTGVSMAVNGVPLSILVRRISASGNFITDYLLFVPADDNLSIVKWGTSSPNAFAFNGVSRSVYGLDAAGRVADIGSAGLVSSGGLMVSPGVTNRVIYINDVSPQNSVSDAVGTTVTVSPYYWPRYLDPFRPTST